MKFLWIVFAIFLAFCVLDIEASVFAKSTKTECVLHGEEGADLKTKDGNPCKQKLVIALTITGNEGKAQAIEANVARIVDKTEKQIRNVQLKNPVRIRINKSPMLVNYRLYQVGNVYNYPHEQPRRKSHRHCRDDWYANSQAVCGYAHDSAGEKIFDSQGFCCYCNVAENNQQWRGQSVNCMDLRATNLGHCLIFDDYRFLVFGLYPPEQKFTITITVEQLAYSRKDGDDVWTAYSSLEIGPHKRIAKSEDFFVKAEYIADFNPSMYVKSAKLAHTYVLIPDQGSITNSPVYQGQPSDELNNFISSLHNVSEWMAVSKEMFDFTGSTCNKIGIGYAGFRYQNDKCTTPVGSCLDNQPFLLWKQEKELQSQRKKGEYMLYNYGKVHSVPHTNGKINYQLNFLAERPTKSVVMLSMVADDIKVVVHKSPGRIIEAYIEAFEALATTGDLIVIAQNIGSLTASYNIFIVHCSAGIDLVPAKMLTLDPNQMENVTFTIHSFHAIGKINYCKVELYDMDNELLDNITVSFETLDTCFCYGHCGCACGNDTTNCPPPPPMANGTSGQLWNWSMPRWLQWVPKLFRAETAMTFVLIFWIIFLLWCLGNLKICHMIITGQIDFPMVTEPVTIVLSVFKTIATKIFKEFLPEKYDECMTGCEKSIVFCCAKAFCVLSLGRAQTTNIELAAEKKVGRGWRRPRHCNGMCSGAKDARKRHRKQMRINKRKGMKSDIPWFQKPYTCTCKVKDTMPCCEICKGMFFFFYCPLLPLFWILEYIWIFARQKWRRHKRKKRFRELRAAKQSQKDKTYLLLDKYSRGKVEREILDFSKDLKMQRQKKKMEEIKGFDPNAEELDKLEEADDEGKPSQEESSSDTTDVDEAGDLEELLDPEDPVYFNYASADSTPSSLTNPGKSFSIKGRVIAIDKENKLYKFELHTYSNQMKQVRKGKLCSLIPPKPLKSCEFERKLDSVALPKLVTLSPLFPCLNS